LSAMPLLPDHKSPCRITGCGGGVMSSSRRGITLSTHQSLIAAIPPPCSLPAQ
jgi:hypothetical protein